MNLNDQLKALYAEWKDSAPYLMDGLVISSTSAKNQSQFHPDNKYAWKMNSTGIPTTIIGYDANISKGGLLKVTGIVSPVVIDGRTINRVTLNNCKFMEDNGYGIGAEISIVFSGEIIPKIVEVTKPVAPVLPTHCPSCNSVLDWKGVDLHCSNINCPDKKVKALESFLIKAGVEGVTETSLKNWGITGIRGMLQFKGTDGKAQQSFMRELQDKIFSKPAEDLFTFLSFDGAGETTINAMLKHYGNDNLIEATKALYLSGAPVTTFPDKVGIKTVEKIEEDWKLNVYLLSFIMKDARFKHAVRVPKVQTGILLGKSFLITGTLSEGRTVFETLITDNGGTIASSVSKKLSYLIVGANAGSKLDKANKIGVPTLTEDEFKAMI